MSERLARRPCRSCSEQMWWVRTRATGKNMPLNVEPDWQGGNVLLDEENKAVVFPSPEAARQRLFEITGWDGPYLSHFASCPRAVVHRRVA